MATSKPRSSTHLKIKGNCSLKALKFKRLKYTEENTADGLPTSKWDWRLFGRGFYSSLLYYGISICIIKAIL